MTASDWAAWVGAFTGVLALALQAYQHWISGPQVSLSANPNMRLLNSPDKTLYVLVKATNNGTAKTTITHLSVCTYSSWWRQWLDKADEKQGVVLAHHPYASPMPYPLDVGDIWTGLIVNDDRLKEMGVGKRLYCRVFHSGSEKPARARIRVP